MEGRERGGENPVSLKKREKERAISLEKVFFFYSRLRMRKDCEKEKKKKEKGVSTAKGMRRKKSRNMSYVAHINLFSFRRASKGGRKKGEKEREKGAIASVTFREEKRGERVRESWYEGPLQNATPA